jgi:hypothetical protein
MHLPPLADWVLPGHDLNRTETGHRTIILNTDTPPILASSSAQPSRPSGTLQFIGVANLILCALFVILSVPFFLGQLRVLRSWPSAEAQVIRSEVAVEPTNKHDQLYAARLQVVYVVEQRPVTAELTSFQSSNYDQTSRRAAEFPVGSRHEIRYDPQNPKQARIGAGWNRRFFAVPLITLGCGACFGAIAAGFFLAARFR